MSNSTTREKRVELLRKIGVEDHIPAILQVIEQECALRGKSARDEMAEALLDMYEQYCDDGHAFMSAGERASGLLEHYGYADFDEAGRLLPPATEGDKNK